MSAATVPLPQSVTIDQMNALKDVIDAQLGAAIITLDATAVARIDTAGLQLLLAARREIEARGGEVCWQAVPEALTEAARQAGLDGDLELDA